MPSRAMRSIFGVRRMELPMQLNSSERNPSPRKKIKLGLGFLEVSLASVSRELCPKASAPNAPALTLINVRRDCPALDLSGGVVVIDTY